MIFCPGYKRHSRSNTSMLTSLQEATRTERLFVKGGKNESAASMSTSSFSYANLSWRFSSIEQNKLRVSDVTSDKRIWSFRKFARGLPVYQCGFGNEPEFSSKKIVFFRSKVIVAVDEWARHPLNFSSNLYLSVLWRAPSSSLQPSSCLLFEEEGCCRTPWNWHHSEAHIMRTKLDSESTFHRSFSTPSKGISIRQTHVVYIEPLSFRSNACAEHG